MLVFPFVENNISNIFVAYAMIQNSQPSVKKAIPQKQIGIKAKSWVNNSSKAILKGKQTKNWVKKEVIRSKSYVEEPVVKDSLFNIYTGNPGFYSTDGDTLNFGYVKTLSDSAFLAAQRIIVPKTIKPYGFVGKEIVYSHQDWVLGLVLILWMLFASVRVGFTKYLEQLFMSLVNISAATRLFRQRGYKTMVGAIRLDFIFHLILPLSVFQIAGFFKIDFPGIPGILFFFILLLIINGFLFIKILLYRVAGSISMLKEQTEESVFNIKLYYKALGLFLLPVVTLHAIIAETNFITIWVMAAFVAIMYIVNVVRTIYLGNRKDISIFYLILYLCTLEILPLLLIFKLISEE